MKKGVEVTSIHFKGQDERGVTGEIDSFDRGGFYILGYRKAGTTSGNHYHKGISLLKDPEIVYLLTGSARITYAEMNGLKKGKENTITAKSPCCVTVYAETWHRFEFMEDSCFVELNSFEEGDIDTFKIE